MKGFASFAIIISIIAALLIFKTGLGETQNTLYETTNELIKAETINKERALLENNTDKIISLKLAEQITKQNYDTKKAQDEINSALAKYLNNKAYGAKITGEKISEATKEFLNSNSKTTLLKTRYFTYAEYSFCSTIQKNTTIKKSLGEKTQSEFQIPINYTHKIITPLK